MNSECHSGKARSRRVEMRRSQRAELKDAMAKWPPILLMGALAAVCAVQIWLANSQTQISFEINEINDRIESVSNAIDIAHIEVERRHAPAYVASVAQDLGFVKAERRPVVVLTDAPLPQMMAQVGESLSARKTAVVQETFLELSRQNNLEIEE